MKSSLRGAAVFAIIILGTYEAALRMTAPQVDSGQDQFATNSIRLENYVDNAQSATGVVLGSSLTARVPSDAWPREWQVLSQSGGNALTGLEVIVRTTPLPKRILIEINTLDSQASADDVANAVDWTRRDIRKVLWLSRTAYRPANLLVWSQRPLIGPNFEGAAAGFAMLLAGQRKAYALPPDAWLAGNLRRVKEIVDFLKDKAVKVEFFEMPVDRELMQTPRAQIIRRATMSYFSGCESIAGSRWTTVETGAR